MWERTSGGVQLGQYERNDNLPSLNRTKGNNTDELETFIRTNEILKSAAVYWVFAASSIEAARNRDTMDPVFSRVNSSPGDV